MRKVAVWGFVVVAAAMLLVTLAAGQDTSIASLLRRLELLESANTDVERRVRELESLIKKSEPSQGQPIPSSTKWRDLANWRQLRQGMTMEQVRALLGEPERVDAGSVTHWRWDEANPFFACVDFISGKVDGWSEPRR